MVSKSKSFQMDTSGKNRFRLSSQLTNFSFVRRSLTEDICLMICVTSASESVNDINNRSRSGFR